MANASSSSTITGTRTEATTDQGLGPRAVVQPLRLTTFRWSVGLFCAAVGALMLVVPHQLSSPAFSAVRPFLGQIGALALLSGIGLIVISALGIRWPWLVAAHLGCGAMLVLFAALLLRAGTLAGATVYSTLGVGVAVATLLRGHGSPASRGDLLAVVLGACAIITGLVMLLFPAQFSLSIYAEIRPFLQLFGVLYLLGGATLIVVQFRPPPQLWAFWLPHAVIGFSFLTYLMLVSLPSRAITGMLFYGGFGMLLLLLPLLGGTVDRFDPTSLRVRLILTLIGTAALPLTTTVTLITAQQERIAINQTLTSRRLLALALASNIDDYMLLHQNAVDVLANSPGMVGASPEDQARLLRQTTRAYPEFFACASYAADGSGVSRSDNLPITSAEDNTLFAQLQRTSEPGLELRRSVSLGRPVVAFGAPLIRDDAFNGAVICGVEVTRIVALIEQISIAGDRSVLVVDTRDRLIASDRSDIATLDDLANYPPVLAMRALPQGSSTLRFGEGADERLAAFATVPMLGWGVVVERELAEDLSAVRGARELAFGLLVLAVSLAALAGAVVANLLTGSLNALAAAVSRFGVGDAAAPLPRGGVSEVRHLSAAFDQMRHDLTSAAQGREQAIRQRDSFFSVAAHELKTPLTALVGQAQLFQRRAQREGTLSEKDRRSLDVVTSQAQRLNALITDLLDVSRLEHGRLTLERAPMDLRALVLRVVDEFLPTVEPRTIDTVGVDGPPLLIDGDALRLEQVLHNLLSNAVKYSPAGGAVLVELRSDAGEVRIAVSDQGIGIPADALPQLFERFFRAANAEPQRISGMGVGLFVVHEIVTLHGGRMEVTSVEGQGSTFTVVLPRSQA